MPAEYNFYPFIAIFLACFGGYIVINYAMADFASKTVGGLWNWFLSFISFPVISHLVFIVAYIYWLHKRRGLKVLKSVVANGRTSIQILEDSPGDEGGEVSVTPFDEPDQPESEEAEAMQENIEEQLGIHGELRDARIDELIEWGEFAMAYELAREFLEYSKKKGHANYIKIYEAYIELLKPRVGLHLRDSDQN